MQESTHNQRESPECRIELTPSQVQHVLYQLQDGHSRLASVQLRLQEMLVHVLEAVEQKLEAHGEQWKQLVSEEVERRVAASSVSSPSGQSTAPSATCSWTPPRASDCKDMNMRRSMSQPTIPPQDTAIQTQKDLESCNERDAKLGFSDAASGSLTLSDGSLICELSRLENLVGNMLQAKRPSDEHPANVPATRFHLASRKGKLAKQPVSRCASVPLEIQQKVFAPSTMQGSPAPTSHMRCSSSTATVVPQRSCETRKLEARRITAGAQSISALAPAN